MSSETLGAEQITSSDYLIKEESACFVEETGRDAKHSETLFIIC